jgi:hypothetical protein
MISRWSGTCNYTAEFTDATSFEEYKLLIPDIFEHPSIIYSGNYYNTIILVDYFAKSVLNCRLKILDINL